jgi:hypothetical protein
MPVPLGALDFEGRADWVWARGAVAEEHDAIAEDDPVRVRLREQRDKETLARLAPPRDGPTGVVRDDVLRARPVRTAVRAREGVLAGRREE